MLLSGKISKGEVEDALKFLLGEGHIYSTIDDDHFTFLDWDDFDEFDVEDYEEWDEEGIPISIFIDAPFLG